MSLINAILNFAALLLWIGWRDLVAGSLLKNTTTPLVRTLRRAGNIRVEGWKYVGGLAGLLFLRAVIYWWLGASVGWTPRLDLTAITVPFRSELFFQMLLFSALSFGATLAVFYLSLLLLSVVNHRAHGGDSLEKFVRTHLGRVAHWPLAAKIALPFIGAALVWLVLNPLLAHWGILPRAASVALLLRQGLLLGVAACLIGKYTFAGVLLLHFLNSYVYFGGHSFWNFINVTARRLLTPLRPLPLRIGRMDFAPVVGIALVFLLAAILENGAHTRSQTLLLSLRERYENTAR